MICRRLLVALLCAQIAFPGAIFAQQRNPLAAFEAKLVEAAERRPEQVFEPPKDTPPQLILAMRAQGHPERKITNKQALALYRGLSPKAPQAPSTPADAGEAIDGRKGGQGLRILGIEFGAGRDPIGSDTEPYLRKGIPQLLDWDLRARVALDGLGARAHYRHPGGMRAFNLGFLKYFDVPAALGADSARDDAYHLLGQTPEKPKGGFELGIAGAINQYLGGATILDWNETQKEDRREDRSKTSVEAGISPLGDNPGKSWNYTLLPSVNYQTRKIDQGDYHSDKQGFGFNAGVAFQQALHQLPLPLQKGDPKEGSAFWLDRFKARFDAGYNEVTGAAVSLAAELSVRVFKHLELTGGAKMTFYPSPDERDPQAKSWNPGAIVGIDLHY